MLTYITLFFFGMLTGDFSMSHMAMGILGHNTVSFKKKGLINLRAGDFSKEDFDYIGDNISSHGELFKRHVLVPLLKEYAVNLTFDNDTKTDFILDALVGLHEYEFTLPDVEDRLTFSGNKYACLEAQLTIQDDYEDDLLT